MTELSDFTKTLTIHVHRRLTNNPSLEHATDVANDLLSLAATVLCEGHKIPVTGEWVKRMTEAGRNAMKELVT